MRFHPKVSVIIPTHQRVEKLCRVLEDLNKQSYPASDMEVIVVDDGSAEDPRGAIAALPMRAPLSVFRTPQGGPARARNYGLARAKGDLILFLNDDLWLDEGLVEAHVDAHARHGRPASVMGTFSFIPELRNDVFCRVLEDMGLTHTLQFRGATELNFRSFWTANISVPRAALESLGGFDETFPEPSCEDLEMGYRLEHELGMKLLFNENARALHDHRQTPARWQRGCKMFGRNSLLFIDKHGVDLGQLGPVLDHPEQLEALWTDLELREKNSAGRRQLLEMGPVHGTVQINEGKAFELPQDHELMVSLVLSELTKHDCMHSFIEAFRERQLANTRPSVAAK